MIDRSLNYGRHLIEAYVKSLGPCEKILDIGAGYGDDLLIARKAHPEAQLIGIEAYPPYQEELRRKGVEVHSLDIERDVFPFEPEALDVVMANQILEHTKEVFWIFDQISRTLKVGGHLIIGVPNLAALHNRILLALGRQPSPLKNNSAHVRGFTKRDLVQLLDSGFRGGYRLQEFGGSSFYPFPPALARPLAKALPSMAWGIFFLFEKTRAYDGSFLRYPAEQKLETNFFVGQAAAR